MRYFVFMLVWTKKKFYLNLQQFWKHMMLKIYNYCAATASKVLITIYCSLYGCSIAEFFRDKVSMLYYL